MARLLRNKGAAPTAGKKQIVFVHGKASYGYGGHAYGFGFRMLAQILNQNVAAVNAVVVQDDKNLAVLDSADAIVLGSDEGRLVKTLGDRLEPLMRKGVGLACIHDTLDPVDARAVERLIAWIGGSYERHWSVNPHWEAGFTGMHSHWSWAQDSYRKSVLNAIVWIAGAEVPPGGVPSQTPTLEQLEADLGKPRPANFNADAVRRQIERMNP